MLVNVLHNNDRAIAVFTSNIAKAEGNINVSEYEKYSGETFVVPKEQRQLLQTENKVVSKNIMVDAIPSEYADVTGTTATAADVELGKLFVTAAGILTTGTLDKLQYESGTWSPENDTTRGTIDFKNTHDKPPAFVIVSDIDATKAPNSSCILDVFADNYQLNGYPVALSSNDRYGAAFAVSFNDSGTSVINYNMMQYPYTNQTSSSSQYTRYWATETHFKPYSGSSSRYWRSARHYRWFAIWA